MLISNATSKRRENCDCYSNVSVLYVSAANLRGEGLERWLATSWRWQAIGLSKGGVGGGRGRIVKFQVI
jgi:hypothetical protein